MEQIMPLILLSLCNLHTQNTLSNQTFIPVSIFRSHVLRLMIRIISTVLFTCNKSQSDAEHPKVIPMDLPSSHQVPKGPMTRARARALETEVTSLLSQFHFDEHETWLLPQTETLCILRYQGDNHGDAVEQGEPEEEDGRQEAEEKPATPEPAVLPRPRAVLPHALAVLPRPPAVL